jgi:hypothetical protein
MPSDMPPAHPDLRRAAGSDIERELAESALHPTRDSDRDVGQRAPEVLRVQLAMEVLQPMEQKHISRTRAFPPRRSLRCRSIRMDRKLEELPFGRTPPRAGHSWIQELDDRLEDSVRRKGIAAMDPKNPPSSDTEHHSLIGMGDDLGDVSEAEGLQSGRETVFQQDELPRCPAAPLPRVHSP